MTKENQVLVVNNYFMESNLLIIQGGKYGRSTNYYEEQITIDEVIKVLKINDLYLKECEITMLDHNGIDSFEEKIVEIR